MNDHLSSEFLDRVRRSYRLALSASAAGRSTIWGPIDEKRSSIHSALMAGDNQALRNIFSDPMSSDLFLGADYLCHSILGQLRPGSQRNLQPLAVLAGERVERVDADGVAEHLENVTQKKLSVFAKAAELNDAADAESILRALDPLLNQTISFPNLNGEIGLTTSRGIATYRAAISLHQAWLILRALKNCSGRSVIEFGPGLGRSAYYAFQAGIMDYSTVDLPMGIVAQACFLGAALGPDKIQLYGEEDRAGRIRLYVAGNQPERKYALAFNADSMTEMTMKAAMSYMRWIAQHCEVFLSINYDANLFKVRDLAKKWFVLERCAPDAMHGGYMEEYFVPRSLPSLMPWHKIARHSASVFGKRVYFKVARIRKGKT